MRDQLLTPSKITAWLDCGHYLALRREVDEGLRPPATHRFGEMARMLLDKGLAHEREVRRRYVDRGRTVFEVPDRVRGESFARWVARVAPQLDAGHDVIYQMPFAHDGVRGIADFLERVEAADGCVTYEPVDAKLARSAAKPGHVLQLAFYAEAITARMGCAPERMHVELGSTRRESIRTVEVLPYWRRLRHGLAALLDAPPQDTSPEPCAHCGFCEFEPVCDQHWRDTDALVHVAGLRRADAGLLEVGGIDTIARLAALDRPVGGIDPQRLARLVSQADLQVQARQAVGDGPPPFEILEQDPAPTEGAADGEETRAVAPLTGFAAMPEPDEGDIFLDFEGHPFWRADVGLFFLFGLIERDAGEWAYRTFWAHDQGQEKQAVRDLVDHLVARRSRFPGMHVYHYNHTERTSLSRLTTDYAVAELEVEHLIATGAFVDLLPVVTGGIRAGVESYGLKHIERLTGFQRSHDIDRGAGAVIEYEHWTADHDQSRLDRIARYNEDDVRATMAVRDWLVAHRPDDIDWRPAVIDVEPVDAELDQLIEDLHAFGVGTPEHLMGDLLGYWRRERRVVAMDCLRLSMADPEDQLDSQSAIVGLRFRGFEERLTPKGNRRKWPAAVFDFPPQPLDPAIEAGSKMILALQEHQWAFFELSMMDRETGILEVSWNQGMIDQGVLPSHLVHYVNFNERSKLNALRELAAALLTDGGDLVGHAILRRELPRFVPGGGPAGGQLSGGYAEISEWAVDLDRSYLPVQGPPGTGKTFTGAHVIHALVQRGLRVGVTAMSHSAIDNLLQATVERFSDEGVPLRAVHKHDRCSVPGLDGSVPFINDNGACATGDFDVVAGTPWLFASSAMRQAPVDVLVVDEAGQLGLADTLAATVSARSVVLLGDPQQLPQVAQASHPNRSGVSALEHLLGEGVRTFPPERGVLLDRTWRMHPEVCRFISEVMYDGRLTSEASCARQRAQAGTGLRRVRAEHAGHATESPEEAGIVAALVRDLLGTDWTDQHGRTRPLGVEDVIVVTPYNDQRRLITTTLAAEPAMAGVEVGTVDKFQGREAAVVVFSMATSSAAFMPRDADFLFSKNRLNVAVSRARCLAYLICTDDLLDTRARDVEQMILIAALCAFVEQAEAVPAH